MTNGHESFDGVGTAWPAPPASPLPPPPPAPSRSSRSARAALVGGLVGAVVAGGVAFGTVKLTDDNSAAASPAPAVLASPAALNGEFDIHGVLDKVAKAVVAIEVGQQRGTNI